MAKKDKLALESLLEQVLRHLLLLQYWKEERSKNYGHWQSEIISFRGQINKRITTNLYRYLEDNLTLVYKKSRKYVIEKSGINIFPLDCPYKLDQLLDKDWFPDV